MEPLISVIIPTFNCGLYLKDAVDSVFAQTFRDYEVIIVDDGSTDNTAQIVDSFQDGVVYIRRENKGPSAARNTGIKASKGRFLAFLDADDIWLSEKLDLQIKQMARPASLGIVSCGAYFIDENGNSIAQKNKKNYSSREKLMADLCMKNSIACSSALMRKECLSTVGLFDETIKKGEDWDMWLRVGELYDISFVEAPLVKIRFRQHSLSSPYCVSRMTIQYELSVLKKAFALPSLRNKFLLKKKAYGRLYFSFAGEYYISKDMTNAARYIFKAILYNPLSLASKKYLGLISKIILSRILRFSK